ncbi:unnamed protein product [Amoebophrya sp. A25]|nr:unnamed protein product [Amoebophrya sp. A25]|eukprot:GSA25T00014214001.1
MFPSVLHKAGPPAWQRLLKVMQEIAPLELAAPWDNVGLLLDCPDETQWASFDTTKKMRLFFCNDLTEQVVEEVIARKADCVITYHPTPFGKMNKITRHTHIGRVMLSMLTNRIPVYATHTSFDCVTGGINDWLLSAFGSNIVADTVLPVEGLKGNPNPAFGFGRVCDLEKPLSIDDAIGVVKAHTKLPHLRLGEPMNANISKETKTISRVAVCAGSGGSVFKGYRGSKVDLFISGEMSHHDVLELNQNGAYVLLCEHSNSERGFLPEVARRIGEKMGPDYSVEPLISEVDRDPLRVA